MENRAIAQGGLAGVGGGILWVFWSFGTAFFLSGEAVDVIGLAYGISLLVPAALILVALWAFHHFHARVYRRTGRAGSLLSGIGIAAMGIGLPIETVALYFGLERVSVIGHSAFLLGFFVLVLGSLALGIAIYRAALIPYARAVGLWLAFAVLFGFIVQIVLYETGVPEPAEDFFFWIGLLAPYGLAWIVLGYSLRRTSDRADRKEIP